jgi:hypothetical protein
VSLPPARIAGTGTGRRRAAAFLLSCLFLVLALAATTVHYTVAVEEGRVRIDALGHRFVGPPVAGGEPLLVLFSPQDRHSTGQSLLRDRGPFVDGWLALAFIAGKNHDRPQEFRVPVSERWSFAHFNPFRATVSVRVGEPELRLEVNIPDASIEAWDRGAKLETVRLDSPWIRLTLAPLLAALAAAGCLLAAVGVWPRPIREAAREDARPGFPGPRSRTAVEAALIGAGGALLVGGILIGAFDAMPGFGDEMNYLIQGKIFASGRLWVPPPPEPEFYRVSWMDMSGEDGKVWGFHPPGNSAILAFGWLVGVYWLTVPLVGGALLAVQYLLGLELFRRRGAALLHVALIATSHYVLSLASSFMAHAPSMLLLSLSFLFLMRFDERGRGADLALAALFSGLAFTVRPLSAVLAAAVPLLAIVTRLRRTHLCAAAGSLAIGLALAASVFAYTRGITGKWELPYLVKGPEAGQTLAVRLAKGLDVHLGNLYRNCNELQHRVHSGGILGNAVLFFVGLLVARRDPGRRWLRIAAGSFVFFVVAHSVLHWYGWKWEPRMLYDVSFLAFLVSTAGLSALLSAPGRGRPARELAAGAAVVALGWVAIFDLPRRLATEYKNYNGAAVAARREVAARGISDAVVFFEDEVPFSCYTPFNDLDGGGDVVYARHRGDLADYRLLARFPGKRSFLTRDGRDLVERPNFYRGDGARLAREVERLGAERATTVVPWRSVAPSPLLDALPGATSDVSEFLDGLPGDPGSESSPRLVSLVGSAADLAPVLDSLLITTAPGAEAFEGPLALRRLAGPRGGRFERLPGILMTCFANATWNGPPTTRQLVAGFDADLCPGEDRSITFESRLELARARQFRFSLDSDDGSGLWLDGHLVIDNDLASTHGPQLISGSFTLGPGRHDLLVKYFNGPGDARLRVLLEDRGGTPVPLTVAAFADEFYLHVDPPPEGPGGP